MAGQVEMGGIGPQREVLCVIQCSVTYIFSMTDKDKVNMQINKFILNLTANIFLLLACPTL